jgi:hypothetical protein
MVRESLMNVDQLDNAIKSATTLGQSVCLHPGKDVVIQVSDGVWLELNAVSTAFVNGRFVLQLRAGDRDGQEGMHW